MISEAFFQGLSDENKAAVLEAADEAGAWQLNYLAEKDVELLEALTSAGMAVTEPDKEAFREATAPAYDVFYKQYGDEARAFVEAIRGM